MRRTLIGCLSLCSTLVLALPAGTAEEVTLGAPMTKQDAGLVMKATYSPPVAIEASGPRGQPLFLAPDKADLFLGVDVRAAKGNKNGYGAGEVVPYLTVAYALVRPGGSRPQRGQLHAVATTQGLRYGNNVKLSGPGIYTLTLTMESPLKVGFGRHTDLETGVGRWWKPFQAEWTLKYSGSAK